MSVAAALLAADGYGVYGYANDMAKASDSLHNLLSKAQYAVLPFPYSKDGETVFTPCSAETVMLSEIFDCGVPILAGQISGRQGMTDYCDESMLTKNAVLTAEAALNIAASAMRVAYCDASAFIIGSGRIAKALATRLLSLGAKVSVTGRNEVSLAYISSLGCTVIPMSEMRYGLSTGDVIFNTVPSPIIDVDTAKSVRYGVPFIELASPPYCISKQDAQTAMLGVTYASGLPGKHYPVSAGRAIYQNIKKVCTHL